MNKNVLDISTRLVHGSKGGDSHTGALSFPIYQSATFRHPGLNQSTGYDYTRTLNPTRQEVEETIAILENAKEGFAFSSGMAAVSALLDLFAAGDHLIVSEDIYGGTYRLFDKICRKRGVEFSYIDTCRVRDVRDGIRKNTKAIFVETPSNPMMKVTDISAMAQIAKNSKALLIVDNTFLTPYFQRPLELGADIVLHSGTKFLGGHNDTLAGFIAVKDRQAAEKIKFIQNSAGAVLAPFDSWLILRGIKTLGVRLEKQQKNAMKIARWLKRSKSVEKVYYTGLEEHSGYEISKKQASGFGSMISFTVKDPAVIEKLLGRVRVFSFAESLGGVESLITYPVKQTHADIPWDLRNKLGINEKLMRLSVGIEAADDLIADLKQALR